MAPLPTSRSHHRPRRTSSLVTRRFPHPVDRALRTVSRSWPVRTLTDSPSGSGLDGVRGDQGLPVLGHTLDYFRFGSDLMRERYARLGPVSWMGAFGTKVVVVAGPAATQSVLANKDKAFSQDGWTFLIDAFFHRGLMLMSFGEHLAHRRIMQEAFVRGRLTRYVDQVVPRARAGVAGWSSEHPVQLYPLLKELTLDVATDVFMGGRGGEDTRAVNDAFVATVRAASSVVRLPLPGTRFRAGVQGRKVLEGYFFDHLPAARAGAADDLFAGLCQARTADGESFSDQDVVNHMIFLMMAAHDTSTITTAAVTYFLAKHPEWQERAREESLALGDGPVDIGALESLGTLDLVIKEALRLVAPVPLVMRRAVQDTEVEGHFVPAGSMVAVASAVNHFDPEVWTDPDDFDPSRFGPDRAEDKAHRHAWIPFGGGAHKCIGMHFGILEVTAILHEMLTAYRWTVPEDYEVRWDNTSLPVPVDGLPIRFHRVREGATPRG